VVAVFFLPHVHPPDIDVVPTQGGPDTTDGTGSVIVENQQDMSFRYQFQPEIVDLDHLDVTPADDRAGNDVLPGVGADPQGDQVGVVFGFRRGGFGNRDAHLLGHHRCVDES
jgi:hypothetical protein